VRVTLEIQGAEVIECDGGSFDVDVSLPDVTPQCLHDFQISKVGCVQAFRRVGDARGNGSSDRRYKY
jgi:hypothetical protein